VLCHEEIFMRTHPERHFLSSAVVRDVVIGIRSALQTVLVGGLAATAAYLIARAIALLPGPVLAAYQRCPQDRFSPVSSRLIISARSSSRIAPTRVVSASWTSPCL